MRSSIWEWPIFLASVTILTSGKKQARQWLQKSADRGNNMAQLALGDMYASGQGIPQNKKQAMTLFLLGRVNFQLSDEELQFMALQGDTQAQIKLASKYGTGGSDCSRNESLALYWLREAATNGDSRAQFMLGMGLATDRQYDEAITWLKKAQSQGVEEAGSLIERIQEEQKHH
ncbi:tetratricopeptide repeat protein [Salmonella enterica]